MKALPILTFVAATFAFLILPFRFEIAASVLSAAGLLAVAVSDYSRMTRPLTLPAPTPVRTARKERFGLAA